ncbi:MAG: hypothetical protein AAB468_02790 [Patescibacteria group bacterium]
MSWLDKYWNLKSYQQDRDKLDVTTRVEVARKILGDKRVISRRQALLYGRHDLTQFEPLVPFSEIVLRSSAYANAHQDTDWRLFYAPGLQPKAVCDLPVLENECARWHLINWRPFALGESFERQEALVKQFGPRYKRAHEAVVVDGILLFSHIHQVTPLAGYAHCGHSGIMKTCHIVSGHGLQPYAQEIRVERLNGKMDQTWGVLVERLP